MLGGLFKVSAARSVPARSLAENVQKLPSTDSVRRVRLPALNITIDNIPGKKASVAIYSFLAAKHARTVSKQKSAQLQPIFNLGIVCLGEATFHRASLIPLNSWDMGWPFKWFTVCFGFPQLCAIGSCAFDFKQVPACGLKPENRLN
eukprot:175-Pelagomonas_calceolata.AAC.2